MSKIAEPTIRDIMEFLEGPMMGQFDRLDGRIDGLESKVDQGFADAQMQADYPAGN